MVDGDLFDKLARIGQILRKRSEPFGAIQVSCDTNTQRFNYVKKVLQIIVTGDFFQLPPVMKGGNPKFAFEAECWADVVKEHTYNLTKVFRQKDQSMFSPLAASALFSIVSQHSSICSTKCDSDN